MKFNSQLSVKKGRSNLIFFLISLILAFLLALPVTFLTFEVDPHVPMRDKSPPPSDPSSMNIPPFVVFLFVFLIMIAPIFIILTFFKAGSQFAYNKILNNENRKKIIHQFFFIPEFITTNCSG